MYLFCKKPCHKKEACWKLHRKQKNIGWIGGTKGSQQQSQAHITMEDQQEKLAMDIKGFKKEEIMHLETPLAMLEKPAAPCPLAQASKSISYAFSASNMSNSYVIDSRAKNHITHSSSYVVVDIPCFSNRKVKVADDTLSTIASQGEVTLTPLRLKNGSHAPKWSMNLLPIHQITKNLNCSVTFFPTHCVFQDRVTRRMIGLVKEKYGSYFLEEEPTNGDQPLISCLYKKN